MTRVQQGYSIVPTKSNVKEVFQLNSKVTVIIDKFLILVKKVSSDYIPIKYENLPNIKNTIFERVKCHLRSLAQEAKKNVK